jgi:hypothetical protein
MRNACAAAGSGNMELPELRHKGTAQQILSELRHTGTVRNDGLSGIDCG